MAGPGKPVTRDPPAGACILLPCALILASCAVDLGFDKRDGWPDDGPDDQTEMDVAEDEGPGPDCGNGEVEGDEECDGDPARDCTTSCGSTGTQRCVECVWAACEPPVEVCNGADDDCDDMTDESGQLSLTAGPLRVSNVAAASLNPAIDWSGAAFGLVWQDEREGRFDLFSAVVDAEGTVVEAEDLFLSAVTSAITPDVVWANDVHNVVFTDHDGSDTPDAIFQRMDAAGDPTGGLRVVGDDETDSFHKPCLVERTGGFAVAWDSSFAIHLGLTNVQGNPAGAAVDVVEDGNVSRDVTLAYSGADFGLAWVDERDGNPEIYAAIVEASGTVSHPDIRLTDDGAESEAPSLVWDGSTFAVVWADGRTRASDVFLTRFNLTGTRVGGEVQATFTAGAASEPALAWTGSTLGLAWSDDGQILFRVLETGGARLTVPFEISGSEDEAVSPDLVWTGSLFGLAWQDDRDGNDEIYIAVVEHGECP